MDSYPERWRDWPDEARQPVFIKNTTVPIPAMETLRDERGIMLEFILFHFRKRIFNL
jgi:hypothetical protein